MPRPAQPPIPSEPPEPLAVRGPYCVQILNAGGDQVADDTRRLRLPGNAYRLVSVRTGTVIIQSRQTKLELGPGEAALLAPAGNAHWRATMRSLYFTVAFVVTPVPLGGPLGNRQLPANAARQPTPHQVWGVTPPAVLSPTLAQRCHHTVDLIRGEYWQNAGHYLHACARLALLLSEIVLAASRPTERAVAAPLPGLAAAVQQRLREIGHPVPRIRALADHLGVTREHLSRAFHQETGQTLAAFLNDARWAHAVELLAQEHITMTLVANGCGFRSPATFNAGFHRRFGCSPTHWRKHQRV